MLIDPRRYAALLAALALAPAAHSWWSGRRLLARPAYASLPEALQAHDQRNGAAAAVCVVAVGVLALESLVWTPRS